MTILLLFLGSLLVVVGALMLLVAAFRVSIWWGLASLLIPFVQIIFVFIHWSESKSAVFTQIIGLLLILAAVLVGGDEFTTQYKQQLNRYMPPAAAVPQKDVLESGVNTKQEAVTAPETIGQKKIYKCVDARGKIAYTDQPCVNGKEKKVITIQNDIDPAPTDKINDIIDNVKDVVMPDSEPAH